MCRCARLVVSVLLLGMFAISPASAQGLGAPDDELPDDVLEAEMVRVIDGDTIEVSLDGTTEVVRLIGVDSPESNECFALESQRELRRLLRPGRTVWLELDVSERDRYERILAYVWVVRGSEEPYVEFVNERLAMTGFAIAASYPPDTKYEDRLYSASQFAEADDAGFWSACGGDFRLPEDATGWTGGGQLAPLVGDCSPFASFEDAQAYYQSRPDAQPIIDPDADGLACEVWFGVESSGPAPAPAPQPAPPQTGCHPSYPDFCIPPPPPDLNCPDIGANWFTVLPPDPHGFDRDRDGWGCES
jgi:micrococcal nuclease